MRTDPEFARLDDEFESPYRLFQPRPDRPELFDEQTSFVGSTAKVSVCLGGNRSGKTEAAAYKVAKIVRNTLPPRNHFPAWIIGETYDLSCGVCWSEKLSKYIPESLIHSIDWYKSSRNWPFAVMLKHPLDPSSVGWTLDFKSFKQGRARMQAASLGLAWFNEQSPLDIVDEVLRGLVDYDAPAILDFTPLLASLEWPERYRNPPNGWRFFHLNSELNTAIAEGAFEQFLASVPEDYRETRRIGLFASFRGAVFKDWRFDRHVVEPFAIPADAYRLRGIDFGFACPFTCVWWARLPRSIKLADGRIAREGTWVLYREYGKSETLLADHAKAIMEAETWGHQPHIYGPTVADHDSQDAAELKAHGLTTIPADKTPNSVKAGIYAMQSLMLGGDSSYAPRMLVFNTCKQFAKEVGAYRYEPGTDNRNSLEIPVKKDDHCLIAGTMVRTDGGDRLIEHIQNGDRVLTRDGYRTVISSGMTNPAAEVHHVLMSNGSWLVGTAGHPVWTRQNGWKTIDALQYGDIMEVVEDHTPCASKPWYTRALSSAATLIRKTQQTATTIARTPVTFAAASARCIARYGRTLTGRSPKGTTSTTRTKTRRTTISTTLSACLRAITSACTCRADQLTTCVRRWITPARLPLSGIGPMKAGHGIGFTGATQSRSGSPYRCNASSAETISSQSTSSPDFARTNARQWPDGDQKPTSCNAHAPCASWSILPTDTPEPKRAPVHVVRVSENQGKRPVYNLTVAGTPEYFANGILVHNCLDASRYALTYGMRKVGEFPSEPLKLTNTDWRKAAKGFMG